MKKLLLISTAVLALTVAQAQTTFQKTYGGGTAYSVRQTSDNNLIITGTDSNQSVSLRKIDPNGNVLWQKAYTTTIGSTEGWSVDTTNDDGFIIAGTLNGGSPFSKVLLLKADSDGNLQWSKTYGGSKYESGKEVKQTLDGGYIIVGNTKSFGTTNFDDIYVIKTNSAGNLQWSKYIVDVPTDDVDQGYAVAQSTDSSYAVCGRLRNDLNGGYMDIGLIKLNKNGALQWLKCYGGTKSDGDMLSN